MLNHMAIEAIVEQEIKTLLLESTDEDTPLTKQDQLYEIGLHSLLLARLVVQLDTTIGVEPFATGATIADIRTVGDIITVYEQAYMLTQVAK